MQPGRWAHYGNNKAINNGVINAYVGREAMSWIDVDDLAQVAALALAYPEKHAGKTYRLGYDAKKFDELAVLMTDTIGKPFRHEALPPEVLLQTMQDSGAEMTYNRHNTQY